MLKPNQILWLAGLLLFFKATESPGQYTIREGDEQGTIQSRTILVPYAFSTETLGLGLGVGGSYGPKTQSLYYGTAYSTDNGSTFGMLGGSNIRIRGTDRLYIHPTIMLGHFTHMRVYADGNPAFTGERAGSNESSSDNYIEENAQDAVVDLKMRYTLPWGHFRDTAVHTYITKNGILKESPSGADSWNPLESGRSSILFKPYYRRQFTTAKDKKLETLYFELGYEHDNRDFALNPHRGYLIKTSIAHDPDWLKETRRWTSLSGEINSYIPLWDASWSRQQTLALSLWSAYSPSYDPDSSMERDGKAPYFTGPTLGGFWRLRGYPSNRFHDKAAIHYSAEYRVMPEWQPFSEIGLLDPLKVRWWQIVGLVEVGRVAPSWDIGTLHSKMKYDVGIGLRGMFHASIGRLDIVASDEGFVFSAMLGQSF
ncbi:MAG: BamA/TamA family outer membrane protein [Verrucomicrobiota bacterium]